MNSTDEERAPRVDIDLTQFEGHTPGQWSWFGNAPHDIYLATKHSGRTYVMGFSRWGFKGAQPVFCGERVMQDASELITFQVGDRGVKGYAAAKADPSVYRYQIDGIDHPDARLIAAAPDLLAAYRTALARAEAAEEARDKYEKLATDLYHARAEAERQRDEAWTAGAEARALLSRCHEHLHNLTAIIPGNDLAYQKTTDLMAAIRALPIPAQEVK